MDAGTEETCDNMSKISKLYVNKQTKIKAKQNSGQVLRKERIKSVCYTKLYKELNISSLSLKKRETEMSFLGTNFCKV